MNEPSLPQHFPRIVAKCWADEDFKEQFLADPRTVLREEGVDIPEEIVLQAVENSDDRLTLVIPARPEHLDPSEADRVSGGWSCAVYCEEWSTHVLCS